MTGLQKKHKIGFNRRITAGLLSAALSLGLITTPGAMGVVEAAEVTIRETTQSAAEENQLLIGVEGMDYTDSQQEIMARINEVRWDACNDGNVPDPRDTSRMLQPEDYVEMKLGEGCLAVAQIRSAEADMLLYHVRPDGGSCFNAFTPFLGSFNSISENLAWNGNLSTDIEGWIDEKADWVAQNQNAQTGHYTSLINPNYRYTGTASFNPSNDTLNYNWTCTAGAYAATDTEVTTLPGAKSEKVIQKVAVPVSHVTTADISVSSLLHVGEADTASLLVTVAYTTKDSVTLRNNTITDCPVYDGVTWSCKDTSVLEVSADGALTAKKTGEATLTATYGSGDSAVSVERTVLVVPEGVTVTDVENPAMVYAETNTAPVLSKTAKANLSNGASVNVNVTWDAYNEDLLTHFTSKEFDVTGKALGYDVVQRVHINAAEILKIYPAEEVLNETTGKKEYKEIKGVSTDSGTIPKDISVNVTLSNGYTWHYQAGWNSSYFVVWDKSSLEHYKDRAGGDFSVTGYVKLTTDNGEEHFDVACPMHVNPATEVTVEMNETEVTTDSGVSPVYPKATVTWTNGDVSEEDITWADTEPTETAQKYHKREGGDYTLSGAYKTYNFSLTVHVNPATEQAIAFKEGEGKIEVPSGTKPVLPTKALVTWSNGDVTEETVTWAAQSKTDYGKIDGNSYKVKGTVRTLAIYAEITVLPAVISSVAELDEVVTVQGKAPVLPGKVSVTWSNGDVTDEEVSWNAVPASAYQTPDTDFTVKGTVTDFDGNPTEVSVNVHVNERALVSVAWKTGSPMTATSYYNYNKADLTGILIATYDNQDTEEITVTPEMITTFDASSQAGTQTVTVTYEEAGVAKSVNATMKLVKRSGIKILSAPDTVSYIEGESLSLEGLSVAEILDNGEKRTLTDEVVKTGTASGFVSRPSKYGEQTVTFRLYGFSDTFKVTVRKKRLDSIMMPGLPSQQLYVEGQPLSLAGLEVNIGYDNGDTAPLTVTMDMLREGLSEAGLSSGNLGTPVETDTLGKHTAFVLYSESYKGDDGKNYTIYVYIPFEFTVIEKVVESIEITAEPDRLTWPEGDVTFTGFTGGKILAHCNNDYDEVVDLSKTDISGFDLNTVGEQTVTVSYGGKETAFTAWVTEKQVVSTVLTPPTKTSYIEKNMADLAGAKVTVNYDNGTEETITVDPSDEDFEVSFLNGGEITAPLTAGTKTLVVTFKGTEAKLTDGSRVTFDVLEVFPYSKEWVKGKWYNQNGTCTYKYTGSWKKNKKGWWFEDTSGWYPKNQWQKIDGKWYYFKADGFMAAGEWVKGYWLNDNGTWTYKPKGSWKQNAKGWWYETTTGWYPKNMWQKIDGKWYYFNARGYMVTNTTVDGYRIGVNGVANR